MSRLAQFLSRRRLIKGAAAAALGAGTAIDRLFATEQHQVRGVKGSSNMAGPGASIDSIGGHKATPNPGAWVRAWGACSRPRTPPSVINQLTSSVVKGRTIKQSVMVSAGGRALRFRLSNEHGEEPLVIGAASVVSASDAAADKSGAFFPITFSGRPSVKIAPASFLLSDPVMLKAQPFSQLEVRLFLPEETEIFDGYDRVVCKDIFLSPEGDYTKSRSMPLAEEKLKRRVLTGVDVLVRERPRVIVAMGDSITEGHQGGGNWPFHLARRLSGALAVPPAVVNVGISGNQLLRSGFGESALARFDRDVLAVPGVTDVILLIGINDIGMPGASDFDGREWIRLSELPALESMTCAYQQLVTRAHDCGIKIYGGTLTPFRGDEAPSIYNADAKEEMRLAINRWIRNSGVFDAVIDFESALKVPARPEKMGAKYNSGDNLHPNIEGYKAMADSIDLALFGDGARAHCS